MRALLVVVRDRTNSVSTGAALIDTTARASRWTSPETA